MYTTDPSSAEPPRGSRTEQARPQDADDQNYADNSDRQPLCVLPPTDPPAMPTGLPAERLDAILTSRTKWVNGTALHYYFFDRETDGSTVRFPDGSTKFVSWVGSPRQQDVVRESFEAWKGLGLGLEFREVSDRLESEIRIGFLFDHDGSWSAVGRDVLQFGSNSRTMNFGWDLTTQHGRSTALHEIGHTLGMSHEHQNPNSGIEWNEPNVFEFFAGPPNFWDRDKTFHNVLRKLSTMDVSGSSWDPKSIMEYAFPAGLIVRPEQFRDGVRPPGIISTLDRQFALQWYPALGSVAPPLLLPLHSAPLNLRPGQQADFTILPPGTRKYSFSTFGASDAVLVLFEEVDGELRYVAGDDDSGQPSNALVETKLFQGRRYVLRMRLAYLESADVSVMYW